MSVYDKRNRKSDIKDAPESFNNSNKFNDNEKNWKQFNFIHLKGEQQQQQPFFHFADSMTEMAAKKWM